MSVLLEKGYCDAIKTTLMQLAQENNPSTKITPAGFLRAVVENQPSIGIPEYERLRLSSMQGNLKQVRVTYRPRLKKGSTSTTDDCENDGIPAYSESTVELGGFNKYSFIIPTTELEKYCAESVQLAAGQQASGLLREHVLRIMEIVNGIVADMDDYLLDAVVFGENVSTGNSGSTASTLNLPLSTANQNLADGIGNFLTQLVENEFYGTPIIVGAGKFLAYENLKRNMMMGLAQNGLNLGEWSDYKFYTDLYASPKWANSNSDKDKIGVFAPGTVGFVDYDNFVGFKAGKLGTSYFSQIPLQIGNEASSPIMNFDIQVKFLDCPTEVSDGYGGTTTVKRAWQVIISKKYGLWQMPTDAFSTGDRMEGTNGALYYNVTNS